MFVGEHVCRPSLLCNPVHDKIDNNNNNNNLKLHIYPYHLQVNFHCSPVIAHHQCHLILDMFKLDVIFSYKLYKLHTHIQPINQQDESFIINPYAT